MVSPSDPNLPQYSGVSWHKRRCKWRAGFRFRDRDVYLGCFDDPHLAAWVSDFARYLCFGVNPSKWHAKTGRPNFPPSNRPDFPRVVILSKLASANTLTPEELQSRLKQFDESCAN